MACVSFDGSVLCGYELESELGDSPTGWPGQIGPTTCGRLPPAQEAVPYLDSATFLGGVVVSRVL